MAMQAVIDRLRTSDPMMALHDYHYGEDAGNPPELAWAMDILENELMVRLEGGDDANHAELVLGSVAVAFLALYDYVTKPEQDDDLCPEQDAVVRALLEGADFLPRLGQDT